MTVKAVSIHGTELLADDTQQLHRQKLARITLDSMVQFVGLLDANGTVLEINQFALDAVGIRLSDVEGRPFWTTIWWQVSEEINAELRASIDRAARGEFVRWNTEIFGLAGGKETIVIDASLTPVMDSEGNVAFITAEGRDITEKKEREREIARHEKQEQIRIQDLLAQAPAGIGLLKGREHRWVFVNDEYVRMTGRSSVADFAGKTLLESLPELEGQGFVQLLDEVYQTGKPRTGRNVKVHLNRAASGQPEELYLDFVYQPVWNARKELDGIFVHTLEVTERKVSEESRFRLAAIVESADDAIISKDLTGKITSWNEGARRTFGYTAEQIVGQQILRLIPKELHYEEDEILGKLRRGERIDHYETTRIRSDGERIEVSVTISPIRDETGKVIGASKIARDISDRKRIERRLVQSEKLAATGRMAAAIAHEINNPLEGLINLVYLARKSVAPDEKTHGYLLSAEEELERVSHIARQTLGYYRDTALPTETYLHDLIKNVLAVYNSKLIAAGISAELHFNDLQKILISKGEILQVFSNVIANAIDAMRSGGTLSISTRNLMSSAGNGIQVTIRDNGVGIPQEHLPQIFEPFFSTKGNLGTGIGLWIAKQLVDKRGGQLSVASSDASGNSGTTVTVFLPFAAPDSGGEKERV
jgi:PAS domain S-box-containing protein